ncbi:hypothetical protein [Facklamia lactis]|uniref:hypothetical protein n=1 Tax=Facklamia lactis TaxID=2749967 RepID=UPI0018CEAF45|nr:hypothetical protein [Facklamia lactis]MBG9981270.1 hypothetical protein [Facklamia lactis]
MKDLMKSVSSIVVILSLLGVSMQSISGQEEESIYVPRPARPSELSSQTDESEETSEGEVTDEERGQQVEEREGSLEDTEEESKESEESEDPESRSNKEKRDESAGLFETPIVVYPVNEFSSKKDLKAFVEYLEIEKSTKDQFVTEDISTDERFLLNVSYSDTAKESGQPIVLYAPFEFESEAAAEEFIEHNLSIYPDLFFTGEPYLIEGDQKQLYDVAFGIRPHVNTIAFVNDREAKKIYYSEERSDYTYEIEIGEEDPYQEAIEKAFPGQFNFEQKKDGNVTKVTMKQIAENPEQETIKKKAEETKKERQSSGIFGKIKTASSNLMDKVKLKDRMVAVGIPQENVGIVGIGLVMSIILLVLLLIVLSRR